jgi:hypothetical protein
MAKAGVYACTTLLLEYPTEVQSLQLTEFRQAERLGAAQLTSVLAHSGRKGFAKFASTPDPQSRFLAQGLYNRYPITETLHCHACAWLALRLARRSN